MRESHSRKLLVTGMVTGVRERRGVDVLDADLGLTSFSNSSRLTNPLEVHGAVLEPNAHPRGDIWQHELAVL
jgi:hypothetical protein